MWPEKAIFHTALVVVIAVEGDPAGGVALFDPGGHVQGVAGAVAGLKVDRCSGELNVAAFGAELNTFDHPADGKLQRQIVGLIARHGYHAEDLMVVGGRRGDN